MARTIDRERSLSRRSMWISSLALAASLVCGAPDAGAVPPRQPKAKAAVPARARAKPKARSTGVASGAPAPGVAAAATPAPGAASTASAASGAAPRAQPPAGAEAPLRAGGAQPAASGAGARPDAARSDAARSDAARPDAAKPASEVVKTEADSTGDKTYTFGAQEVEGRLASPQILYFLRRVRAQFDPAPLGHRSFLLELSDTRRHPALE